MLKYALPLCALCLSMPALAEGEAPPTPAAEFPAPMPTPTPAAPPPAAAFEPKLGVVFNLQNVFQNASLLSGFRGGVGAQFALSADLWLRVSAALAHSSNPATVVTNVTTFNGTTSETKVLTQPSPTSTFGLLLGGDLLQRLTKGDLAPYVGGGLWASLDTEATRWKDDLSVMNQVSERDDSSLAVGVGARAILGVSWRVHPHFMLFAEYALNITIVNHASAVASSSVTNGGTQTTSSRTSSSTTRVFDFSTALSQGAALGLVAFF